MAKELAEARAHILDADPTAIIANHAFGLYELAMLHITNDDPDMKAARLAIDSLGYLVEGLRSRLDEAEAPLNEALHGVRLLFVERTAALKATSGGSTTVSDATVPDATVSDPSVSDADGVAETETADDEESEDL